MTTCPLLRKYGWNEWVCHTNFSFLIGASHPKDLLLRAISHGYRSLAVTDYDGVYGLARTWRNLREIRDGGIFRDDRVAAEVRETSLRMVCGAEIHLSPDHDRPLVFRDTLVFIVQTRSGYRNLCRIVTRAHRAGKRNAMLAFDELAAMDLDGLVVVQPMRGLVRRERDPAKMRAIYAARRDAFGAKFHMGVSRHLTQAEDVWITPTLALAEDLGIGTLLTQDAYFHHPAQKDISDLVQAIRTNLTLEEASPHLFPNGERALHSLEGIARRFSTLPIYEDALRRSRELADGIEFDMGQLRYHYPKEMIPEGHTAQSWLEHLVWKAAEKIYGGGVAGGLSSKITAMLSHELALVAQLNFADYFLTVWDIVRWARERGILCQGRGSAANSAVCFVLGITAVDPALNDLLFERFISVERGDPPDIDVDFEHERREEVIQYIYERYGRGRAAMVANVITFRRRGSVRAVGKALGVPDDFLERAAAMLASRYFRKTAASETVLKLREETSAMAREKPELPAETLSENEFGQSGVQEDGDEDSSETPFAVADSNAAETELKEEGADIPWQLWGDLAERLKGFPRHLGIHSGGFMLSDLPLEEVVAQEPATMPGRSVVQWCKDDIEALGFFKIDVLSLGMLTAIRKCFALLAEHHGRPMSLATVPQDDGPTYAMIQRADTVGTFQIESRAQMSMLPRLRPRCFYDLVIEVAIIRPGPIQGGMIHPYLRRRNGQEEVSFPDERLRPILARTLGVPIFQEQVMRIAIAVGGFTPGEANELRRHMGAWSIKGDIGPWLGRLAEGMRRNGIREEFVQTILAQMRGFADYGFPESHSASFAILAYVSCWLKCHYPAAFFTALVNSQPMGFYTPHALLQAALRSNVKVLPICVSASNYDLKLENIAAPGRPADYAIRLGLRLVAGLREQSARRLVENRPGAGWSSLDDFMRTSGIGRSDLVALAAAGALGGFGMERRAAIWLAEAAPFCTVLEDVEAPVNFPEESSMERVQLDFAATSTSLGDHPAAIVRREHWCFAVPVTKIQSASSLAGLRDGLQVYVFGMVLVRQAPPSANGMVFFTLEDDTGFINLAFTPQVYEKHFRTTDRQAFLCVSGKLQKYNEGHSIMVRDVHEARYERAEVIPLKAHADPARMLRPLGHDELQPARNYM